jgi:ketosteroid isomerase-like protein
MAEAFERADLVALDSIYHDSVLVFEAGGVDRGWAAYRDGHLLPELEALADLRFVFDHIAVRLAGSTAWVTCRYRIDAIHDGEAIAARGVATLIFQELGNRWRLVHIHTSSAGE